MKGFFGLVSDEQVTYVNAPQLAKNYGLEVRETNCATAADFVNLVTVRGGGHSISGGSIRECRRTRPSLPDGSDADARPRRPKRSSPK